MELRGYDAWKTTEPIHEDDMRRRDEHTHRCDTCGKPIDCDGTESWNPDGHPAVWCTAFETGQPLRCEDCDAQDTPPLPQPEMTEAEQAETHAIRDAAIADVLDDAARATEQDESPCQ